MSSFEVKQTVFHGVLPVAAARPVAERAGNAAPDHRTQPADAPTYYSVVGQSRTDLDDPQNSPSVSMWPYLLASTQRERLNEISIYVERGNSPSTLRYLYFNDVALALWEEMGKKAWVVGRLHRPPRTAVLSFGMPFSE